MTLPGQAILEEVLTRLTTPSDTEVVRAKRQILHILKGGEVSGIDVLQAVLLEAEDARKPDFKKEKVVLGHIDDLDETELRNHPIVLWIRSARAGAEAVVALESQGVLVEASLRSSQSSHPIVSSTVRVDVQVRNYSGGVSVETWLPNFAAGYRLSPMRIASGTWFADIDIFTEDLEVLDLDARTLRTIAEALESYRRGLYLAAASLLGVASEGAWFQVAERLSPVSEGVAKALDGDRPTAAHIQRQVVDALRSMRVISPTDAAWLHSQAELLRRLRNYGAHPRSVESEHLERYFDDATIGVLLLETHSYLTRLGEAAAAAVAELAD